METQKPITGEEKIKQHIFMAIRDIVGMLVSKSYEITSRDIFNDDKGIAITIKTEKEDVGKIIGKEGRTVMSIRDVASSIGKKHGFKITVEVQEIV